MKLPVYSSTNGSEQAVFEVLDRVFATKFNESLIHQAVVAYMNNGRSGTKAQKNRAAVKGGGKKPYKQKGTGRARAGTLTSPIRVGGGRTFAASPRSYKQKINKKMHRVAISSILSELVRQDRLMIVDAFQLDQPKTKGFVQKMQLLNLKDVMVITDEFDENLFLASNNLYHAGVCTVSELSPVSLIGYEKVVVTQDSIKKIEEWLG